MVAGESFCAAPLTARFKGSVLAGAWLVTFWMLDAAGRCPVSLSSTGTGGGAGLGNVSGLICFATVAAKFG